MGEIKISSTLASFIADCCLKVQKIGIHHLYIEGGHVQASDRHRDLYINVDLPESDISEPEKFQLSIAATNETAKTLRSVGNGGGDVYVESAHDCYLIKNDVTQKEIKKIQIKPAPTTISDFVGTMQPHGSEIPTITSKGELSLNGNEPLVLLGVYGSQLASLILPDQSEHFFQPQVVRQMMRLNRETYKSYGFLKFGNQDFDLSLHAGSDHLWLLTEGQYSDAVKYQVLEKLTKTT